MRMGRNFEGKKILAENVIVEMNYNGIYFNFLPASFLSFFDILVRDIKLKNFLLRRGIGEPENSWQISKLKCEGAFFVSSVPLVRNFAYTFFFFCKLTFFVYKFCSTEEKSLKGKMNCGVCGLMLANSENSYFVLNYSLPFPAIFCGLGFSPTYNFIRRNCILLFNFTRICREEK